MQNRIKSVFAARSIASKSGFFTQKLTVPFKPRNKIVVKIKDVILEVKKSI